MGKRILLAARYYSIEPLGILYLAGVVRQVGWECKVVLVREFDFEPLYEAVRDFKPDMVGFQIWTGYHLQAFNACDRVREMGAPVVIGGPHATYFDTECRKHADIVVKGNGFDVLRGLLQGSLSFGLHFDKEGRTSAFPLPDRDVVYSAYPELGKSPIKSIFASVGCPFACTYCYAPASNVMHGGFKLTVRPVDEIIAEARDIIRRWPLSLVYFQDDIFGYDQKWLEEFARKWKSEIGVPFHCQIRLELARGSPGDRRLDLFAQAGCSGITLAIESGNAFLRDQVLFRHMPGELIEEGCQKILNRGMTLRTEQILAVPFSDTATDLATLGLNNRINPTMAWTSILAPYGGTDMGTIAGNFGFYTGNNDDLSETFFDRSVLRHVEGGPRDIEAIVARLGADAKSRVLLEMRAVKKAWSTAAVVHQEKGEVGIITYLEDAANKYYCDDVVHLQWMFNWLAKVPAGEALGRKLLNIPEGHWTWTAIGTVTEGHLLHQSGSYRLDQWKRELASQMELSSPKHFPQPVAENPWYFVFFPEGATLARKAVDRGVFSASTFTETQNILGAMTRRHLFHFGLYKIEAGRAAIAP